MSDIFTSRRSYFLLNRIDIVGEKEANEIAATLLKEQV